MAFNIPRNPTLLESLGLGFQNALPGLVAGAQQRTQQGALGQIGQQLGLTIPPGTPPQVAQALFAAALQRQGQSQQPFTLPAGAQRFGPGGELIAESPFAPQRPTAPRAPTAFESTQTQIDSLSAIPEDQRTPTQQARLDQLLDRKELTKTQEQAKEIRRIQAIPENRRTPAQKESLKKLLEGTAGVQVNVGPKQIVTNSLALGRSFRGDERIKDMRTIEKFTQNMVTAFNRSLTQTKNFGPIDIALAKSFQKLTDLGSTVREGEFATTFEGQRLINRIRGKVDALLKGGLGFTPEDRKELVDLALALQDDSKKLFNQAITEFTITSDELGLKTRAVLGGIKPFDIAPIQPIGRSAEEDAEFQRLSRERSQ